MCPLHANHRMPPMRLPMDPDTSCRQSPKRMRPSKRVAGVFMPQALSSNGPRAPRHCNQVKVPNGSSHGRRPGSLFATHGEHVQVLVLDDAVRDVGHHRLQSSGRGGQEESHLGPRHAIREARVQKRRPCVSALCSERSRSLFFHLTFRVHVRCMCYQRARRLVNRETVIV